MPEQSNRENNAVNGQIIDAVKQVNNFLKDSNFSLDSISNQLAVQAAGLAMLNIVNQQQQLFTLQNAVTTAAVKSMLNSSPQEAMQIMNEAVKDNNLANSLKELKELMSELKASQ